MSHLCKVIAADFVKRTAHHCHRNHFNNLFVSMTFATKCLSRSSETLMCPPVSFARCSNLCSRYKRDTLLSTHAHSVLNANHHRHYDSYDNFMAKFSQDIDLDALREQNIQELKKNGKNIHVYNIVKGILAEKCDEAISNLNPDDLKKLKVIQLEHDFMFSEGYTIPSPEEMTSENWLTALNLDSKSKRLKYYLYWQKKQFKKQLFKNKKALLKSNSKATGAGEVKEYKPLEASKILLRLYDSAIKRWHNHRLSASMQYGIPLVFDMDYEDYMADREVKNTAKQLSEVYCYNRNDEQLPFHLHFTGCPADHPVYRLMQLQTQNDPHFMATVTPESYLDLFDKDRLVYLSPNGRMVLNEFDPTAVYIVGAYNDKATQKPISFARAKEQKIECMSLPLDHHLQWDIGSKALTLNQIMHILTAIKNRKSWPEAFKAIPSRKIRFRRDS